MRAFAWGLCAALICNAAASAAPVPASPRRIADLWPAHNELLIMLGAADRIAVTVDRRDAHAWMFTVAPAMNRAVQLQTMRVEPEALLAAGVDQAIVAEDDGYAEALRRAGIPTEALGFNNAEQLMRTLSRTADLVGTPYAHQVADRYDAALRARLASLGATLAGVPDAARPTVLHISSLSPLRADTGGIFADWIGSAGGRMVGPAPGGFGGGGFGGGGPGGGGPGGGSGPGGADHGGPDHGGPDHGGPDHGGPGGTHGGQRGRPGTPTSIEQVLAWNPDVLIIGPEAGPFDPDALGGLWRQVRAVRTGRVYRNPSGVFPWDRYGSEYLLQLSWAAKTLHPELFGSVDMVALTQAFYRDYFAYPLGAADARRILDGLPPR